MSSMYVNQFSEGMYAIENPMYISSSSYWLKNGNFVDHFLKVGKMLQSQINTSCNDFVCRSSLYYKWSGGQPISHPLVCYENHRCRINTSWINNKWKSVKASRWTKGSIRESSNTVRRTNNSTGVTFTHTFDGAEINTIMFNRLQIVSYSSFKIFNMEVRVPGSGKVCDFEYNGVPEGIFGISKGNFDQDI
ncbi:hypothetical protein DSO57_1005243 [Entomophthora muscae]|uniref:Uncharacterized protein n=1 Tax=Entomophthora muscae TaxID=34485 RepID=A0ACC2U6F0_9FUNG|nr:hypothetical protein DSO57_1005243 [Entomophthora muscae]